MAAPGLPGNAEKNQADALGIRSSRERATALYDAHRKSLQARRRRDLTGEKILLHIEGSGDNQWADLYRGQRVAIPREVSEFRVSEPLLGTIVENQVAYHCTMPLRFLAEARNDAESRQRSKIDTALANYIAQTQQVNQIGAVGMLFADAVGFCPLHAYWRDDVGQDDFEPLYKTDPSGLFVPKKGLVDCWVGNPFDTTFNAGAKRGSVRAMRYGRVLPAAMIRAAFGVEVEGTNKMASASVFQRTARLWNNLTDLNLHGSPALFGSDSSDEELIAVICEELAPGVDPEWPQGRLTIICLPGTAETRGEGQSRSAVLLHDEALPASRFSAELLYSAASFDDVHGKPWAEPLSMLQVRLNIALSKRREYIEKALNAPILTNGTLHDDTAQFNGYTLMEIEGGNWQPRVMEVSNNVIAALDRDIEEIRTALYTIGGYQAASRGESNAGDPFAKVALLAQQDDTIHGPTNLGYRGTMSRYAQLWWHLFKTYGDVGWVIDAVGDEFEDLPEEYIDNTQVSEVAPNYRVVSGYGATPEIKGRQLMQLVQVQGADGQPVLRTDEFRKQWPDGSLFNDDLDPGAVQRKRAKRVANHIRRLARQFRQQTGLQETEMSHPWVQMAGQQVFMAAEQKFPRLRDDDLMANLAALSELTQDETEDAVARVAATFRQNLFYTWQAAQAMQGAPPMDGAPQGGGGSRVEPEVEQDPAQALAEASADQQTMSAA